MGHFKGGCLDTQGLILFENGLVYKGEIYGGKIFGRGVMYDPYVDETKTMTKSQDNVQRVLDE